MNCSAGKISISESGSWACESCAFIYIGSNRCDVPVMGFVVVACTTSFIVVIYCIARSQYRSWTKRTGKLARDVKTMRNLVHDKNKEMLEMKDAWKISWEEVEIDKELASGAYVVFERTCRSMAQPRKCEIVRLIFSKYCFEANRRSM